MELKPQLVSYLRQNPEWQSSGNLQRLEWRNNKGKLATPSNISRRLRELENEGIVEVIHPKNHAHYRLKAGAPVPMKTVVVQREGRYFQVQVPV